MREVATPLLLSLSALLGACSQAEAGEEGPPQERMVRSVAVRVHHLAAMVAFYSEAFGVVFEEVETFGVRSQFGELDGMTLKLVPIREAPEFLEYPLLQLGIEVDDIDRIVEVAERHGGRSERVVGSAEGGRHGAVRDPDGNTIELYERGTQEGGEPVALSEPWRPLLEPGSFDGWHTLPGGHWEWHDRVLVGTSEASETRHGLLVSDAMYGDFHARIEFRAVTGCSGFYFRVEEVGGATGVAGFQAEVEPNLEAGGLYETAGRAWVVKPDPELVGSIYTPGEWATMEVIARGRDVTVKVNGTITAELRDDPGRTAGHFALQLHGRQDLHVEFRNLTVRSLEGDA